MAKQTRTMTNEEILARHAKGATYKEIAEEAGLSAQRVSYLCRRGSTKKHRGKSVYYNRKTEADRTLDNM